MAVAVLRHHDPAVAAHIRDLQRASYAVEAELIGFDQMPGLVEERDEIARLALTIIGWSDDTGVHGLLGYSREHDVVDVDRVAVRPSHFRRRIGRSLLDALHQREQDASRFEVSTGADNRPAIALYRQAGYRLVGTETAQGVRLVHLARGVTP